MSRHALSRPVTSTPASHAELSVEEAFGVLHDALQGRVAEFARVGGDVAFYVIDGKPPGWCVTTVAGHVVVKPGTPAFPVCTIGLSATVLSWLVQGTLDVAKAFRKNRLAVEGDLGALGVFVRCFS